MKLYLFLFLLPSLYSCTEPFSGKEGPLKVPVVINQSSGANEAERLIVFADTIKDLAFTRHSLPQLKAYAKEKELSLELRNPAVGLPAEITSTPAIIYQSPKGRHIFAGRYTMMSSVQNFIRGSRLYHPSPTLDCRKNAWVWETGRAKVLAVTKVTPLQGFPVSNFQANKFQQQSQEWIRQNSQLFHPLPEACLQKTDRIFYFNFHPYRAEDGTCFLSLELYSPFSCIDPIFKTETPLSASADNWKTLFSQSIQQLETELKSQLAGSTIGDAIRPVAKTVSLKSWEDLGLTIPEAINNDNEIEVMKIEEFPEQWQFSRAVDEETPLIQFNFMAPLNRYVGEVKELEGQLEINEQGEVEGFFQVNTQSLTMGSSSFDEKIHKKFIKAFKYPKSSFRFNGHIDQASFETGRPIPLNVEGEFQLMKYKHPLRINAQLLPFMDEQGRLRLLVEARFQLRITRDYQLEGPDGPAPENETMLFNLNFIMQPK